MLIPTRDGQSEKTHNNLQNKTDYHCCVHFTPTGPVVVMAQSIPSWQQCIMPAVNGNGNFHSRIMPAYHFVSRTVSLHKLSIVISLT